MSDVTVATKSWVITYKGKKYNVQHFTQRTAIERFLNQYVNVEDGDAVELELDGQKYLCEAKVETNWDIMKINENGEIE